MVIIAVTTKLHYAGCVVIVKPKFNVNFARSLVFSFALRLIQVAKNSNLEDLTYDVQMLMVAETLTHDFFMVIDWERGSYIHPPTA